MRLLALLFRDWTAQNLAALAVLGVALAVSVAAAARVVSPPTMPAATPLAIAPVPRLAPVRESDDAGDIAAALEADPFGTTADDEHFASSRDDVEVTPPGAALPAPALPTVRLQGVAFLPGGARAVISVGERPARLLRQGQMVTEQLRIARVTADGVTLASPDTTFVLRLARNAVSTPVPPSPSTVAAGATRP